LDKAGQKGTGKWTAIAALESGTAGQQMRCITSLCGVIFVVRSDPDRGGCICTVPIRHQGRARSR
jgi:hypothetical protein